MEKLTIAECDRLVKELIRTHHVHALESILFAVARAAKDEYCGREYTVNLLDKAFQRIEEWGE